MDTTSLRSLGEFRSTTTDEYAFCCPFCVRRVGRSDTGFHLYVNPLRYLNGIRGWFYCHRCGAKGPMARLFGKKVTELNKTGHLTIDRWRAFVKKLKGGVDEVEKRHIDLPRDYMEVMEGTDAYRYLQSRGITKEQILFYKIGFGTEDIYEYEKDERKYYAGVGRLVFPDYDNDGNVIYWVARTYRNHKIKYRNPVGFDSRDQIYNLANASVFDTVVVTEGVTSAIASGYNAVATYGKGVTDTQVSMLTDAGFDRYVLALDGDATIEQLDLAERLRRRCCKVRLVDFKYFEDPGNVGNMGERVRSSEEYSLKKHLVMRLRVKDQRRNVT